MILKKRMILALTLLIACLCVGLYFTKNIKSEVLSLKKSYPYYDFKEKKYLKQQSKPLSWLELENASKYAIAAIVVSEDWAFYDHNGIDLQQLEIVIKESISARRLVRGASTITQQVVKNVFLSSEKSLVRKFKELIYTYYLEKNYSKQEILEIYLNIIELGKNIYGINSASEFYFEKLPKDLTAKESAFLAMLLPSPKRYAESYRNRELTSFAREVVASIMIKMRQFGVYTEEERIEAMGQILFLAEKNIENSDQFIDEGYY